MTLAAKADHAEQPKGHRKYPRALLVRSDVDGRDRVGILVIIIERAEGRARPSVPTVEVPHRERHASRQSEYTERSADSDGGRVGLPT